MKLKSLVHAVFFSVRKQFSVHTDTIALASRYFVVFLMFRFGIRPRRMSVIRKRIKFRLTVILVILKTGQRALYGGRKCDKFWRGALS